MCGIFGMIGDNAISHTLHALKLLEYRGYDSAGVAARRDGRIEVCKTEGRIAALVDALGSYTEAAMAIGHTRWATHGKVCSANAHPFLSQDGQFAIVHNGIIENYLQLKQLVDVPFSSQTDSEVVAHLLQRQFDGDVLRTVCSVGRMLKGSFAIAIMSPSENKLYAIKNKSPLIVGLSAQGAYLCSDIRCASHFADRVAVTPDNTVVELSPQGALFFDLDGSPKEAQFFVPERAEQAQDVEGDFMLKEIMEIPDRLRDAKRSYLERGSGLSTEDVRGLKRIYLVGCGTAYHSGLQAASVARHWLPMDLLPVIASEFLYDAYPVDGHTLAILISQSGETADTVRAAERIKAMGGKTLAVTNTTSSSLTFVCDKCVPICAGAEYAVASTKAYNCQLLILTLLLLDIGYMLGTADQKLRQTLVSEMDTLPDAVESVLLSPDIKAIARRLSRCSAVFYIGRTWDSPTASEGSLKLKEISYIHSEAYPAGELKHGTLALMDSSVAVVAIATDSALCDKMVSSVTEVAARGAFVAVLSPFDFGKTPRLPLPQVHPYLYGIVSVVPLQLLAYHTAKTLGRDVDKPRHLAKSVTVE